MINNSCDPQAAADFLRSLAHPMRLTILCRLLEGELSVAGFESELGLKQPNLSQQLGQLREGGLVTTRREAKSVFYRLADDRVQTVLNALWESFTDVPPVVQPVVPPSRAIKPSPKTLALRAVREATECGVFPVVGWPNATRSQTHG